jgi:hypothetical protein
MSSDDDGTSTRLLALLDKIYLIKPFTLVGGLELLGKIIISNTPGVYYRFGRQNVLGDKNQKIYQRLGGLKIDIRRHLELHFELHLRRRTSLCNLSQSHRIF